MAVARGRLISLLSEQVKKAY